MYKWFVRPLLFLLPPETAHHFTLNALKTLLLIPGFKELFKWLFAFSHPSLEREVFGIKFKNPIGLAAGFDKDANAIDELATLGFGFIEIGTITPKGQSGNPQPRLFRLPEDASLINRMGFNNQGVDAAIKKLRSQKSQVVIGGNIGKNKDTLNENAVKDYLICFEQLFPYVDYFVVNVSSPNTPNLRELQEKEPLENLLRVLINKNLQYPKPKPILLKIAPDLNTNQLDDIVELAADLRLDGIIATNTTISRDNLNTPTKKIEFIGAGGLSGKPLTAKSNEVIRYLNNKLNGQVPIVGVGGIFSVQDAIDKFEAGASLIQIYTGFVYEGPAMIKRIKRKLVHAKL